MARLFGKTYTREQLLRRVGDVAQVGGPRAIGLQDGNQRGIRAVDCATEPSTMPLMPRDQLRKRGELECLEPGEERHVELEIGVVDSARQIRAIERRCREALKPRRRR